MSALQQWFDGVHLVGQFGPHRTGCWLLTNQYEAAVLEMPPASPGEQPPAAAAAEAAGQLGVAVSHLLCTHTHPDDFCRPTFLQMRQNFPDAGVSLQAGSRPQVGEQPGVQYFDEELRLEVAGEVLFLVHAPKHSTTDTIVIFRGSACVGDWELGRLRSAHDGTGSWAVPKPTKLQSIERLERFLADKNYNVHRVYSVHANDRRESVDFAELLAQTRADRPA